MKKILFLLAAAAGYVHSEAFFFEIDEPQIDYYATPQYQQYLTHCAEYAGGDSAAYSAQYLNSNRSKINDIVNADTPDRKEMREFALSTIRMLNDVFAADPEMKAGPTSCGHELRYTLGYLGHYHGIEQLWQDYYEYAGGAHGLYARQYYLFDRDDRRLVLDDILEPGAKENFLTLLRQAYVDTTDNDAAPAGDHKNRKPAASVDTIIDAIDSEWAQAVTENTDNFYFGRQGVVVTYPPYLVGPFAWGQVELTLPYADLVGIIRSEYLP